MTRIRTPILALLALVAACGGGAPGADPAPAAMTRAPLPRPTGPFPVASLLLDVDDPSPAELLPEGLPRVIEVQIWYPAARDAGAERMPYFPRPAVLDQMIARGYLRQPPERIATWAEWSTHAERGGLPAVQRGGFPLILFTPSSPVPVQQYAALLQELASRGYVILAVEPRVPRIPTIRRSSFGGRVAEDEVRGAADLSLVLRRFGAATGSVAAVAQRADLTRAGVLGHGTGGAVVVEVCTREALLQRCASIDGGATDEQMRTPVPLPLLVLRSGTVLDDASAEADARARWLTLFALPGSGPARAIRIEGAGYLSATDAPWVMPNANATTGAGERTGRVFELTATLLDAFFGGATDAPFAAVDSIARGYDELLVES